MFIYYERVSFCFVCFLFFFAYFVFEPPFLLSVHSGHWQHPLLVTWRLRTRPTVAESVAVSSARPGQRDEAGRYLRIISGWIDPWSFHHVSEVPGAGPPFHEGGHPTPQLLHPEAGGAGWVSIGDGVERRPRVGSGPVVNVTTAAHERANCSYRQRNWRAARLESAASAVLMTAWLVCACVSTRACLLAFISWNVAACTQFWVNG